MQPLYIALGTAIMGGVWKFWPTPSVLSWLNATPSLILFIAALIFYYLAVRQKPDPLKYFDRFCDKKLKTIELISKRSNPLVFNKKYKLKKPKVFNRGIKAWVEIQDSCSALQKRMGEGVATALTMRYLEDYKRKEFFRYYPNGEFAIASGLKEMKKYIEALKKINVHSLEERYIQNPNCIDKFDE